MMMMMMMMMMMIMIIMIVMMMMMMMMMIGDRESMRLQITTTAMTAAAYLLQPTWLTIGLPQKLLSLLLPQREV